MDVLLVVFGWGVWVCGYARHVSYILKCLNVGAYLHASYRRRAQGIVVRGQVHAGCIPLAALARLVLGAYSNASEPRLGVDLGASTLNAG